MIFDGINYLLLIVDNIEGKFGDGDDSIFHDSSIRNHFAQLRCRHGCHSLNSVRHNATVPCRLGSTGTNLFDFHDLKDR